MKWSSSLDYNIKMVKNEPFVVLTTRMNIIVSVSSYKIFYCNNKIEHSYLINNIKILLTNNLRVPVYCKLSTIFLQY